MKKNLLLHACCAPCCVAIIDELKNQYDLTVLFFNPNIFPKSEYEKRKAEVIRLCDEWNTCHPELVSGSLPADRQASGNLISFTGHSEANLAFTGRSGANLAFTGHSEANLAFTGHSEANLAFTGRSGAKPCHSEQREESLRRIKFIDLDYEHENWQKEIKGFENEPEAGKRCLVCFETRLKRTAEFAKENNIKIFASSLTSGRNKNADVIGEIGRRLADEFGLEFMDENWKSKGRQEKAQKLTSERGIYRQNYCGCEFSLPSPFEGEG